MDGTSGTGRLLREAREAAGRSLDELAQETRINARFLAEIEEGRSFSLPAIYRRTFVRTYARALGVDPDTLPDEAPPPTEGDAAAPRADAPPLASGPPVEESAGGRLGRNPFAERSQLRTMIIVVALLFTALVFSVKWFGSGPDSPGDGPSPAATGPAAPSRQESLPAFSGGDSVRARAGADSLVLKATTTESVWVHIVIDNDSTVEYTLPPRYTVTLRAKESFVLAAGNPAGLSITLNGRRMDVLGPGNRPVKNVFLSRKSLEE